VTTRKASGVRRTGRADEGTVLLLILGIVVVAAMLAVVVTDVSALYLQRRTLVAAADGAALAGAQAVDEAEVYVHGLPSEGPVPLDAAAAEEAATAYVAALGIDVDDVRVEATATTVSVQIVTRYRLPISSTVTMGVAGEPVVDASATARTAVMP
jgi:uncharacterized membrane protein